MSLERWKFIELNEFGKDGSLLELVVVKKMESVDVSVCKKIVV